MKDKTKNNFNIFSVTLVAIVTAILVFASRYLYLSCLPFLQGPDAYYYALQIKFFHLFGSLKIAERSILLPLMGFTPRLGLTYEQAIIGWTLLIQILCTANLMVARWLFFRKTSVFSGYLSGIYLLFSPTLTFLCLVFPKYAFALIFLPFWPAALINRKYWPVTLSAFLLSGISHLSMIGIGLFLFGVVFLREKTWRCFMNIKTIIITVSFLCMVLGFLISSKYLMILDWQRISWDGLQPALWTFLRREGIPLALKVEAVLSLMVLGLVFLFRKPLGYDFKLGLFWAPFIGLLTLVPMSSQELMGIAERFSLLLPVVVMLMIMGITKFSSFEKRLIELLLLGSLALIAVFPKDFYQLVYPKKMDPDYALFHQVTMAFSTKEIPMLVAHQGLNYYYKYQTMKESFPYEPEAHWPKQKIWRVVYGVRLAEWNFYLPEKFLWDSGLLLDLPGPYSLIREDCWNVFRDRVEKKSQDEDLRDRVLHSWRNPNRKRPEFSRGRVNEKEDEGEFSAHPNNIRIQ